MRPAKGVRPATGVLSTIGVRPTIGVCPVSGGGFPLRMLGTAAGAIGAMVMLVIVVAAAAPSLLFGGTAPSARALSTVPADYLALYMRAAGTCPGLSWTVLAAIGTVESDNGHSTAPGVASGANAAGAEGPMQFLPATFAEYATPVPAGGVSPASPYDPVDAVFAAARDLCANGARLGADIPGAVFAYNHDHSYVARVLSLAAAYASAPGPATAGAGIAVAFALDQLGVPYRWGGDGAGGFDCSGLVQAAYRAAGIPLPRVAQDQFDAGPPVPLSWPIQPGDLVFFGGSPSSVGHVGIFIGTEDGQAMMVDAPHTGAVVRIEPFPDVVGASWGADRYLGATRPGA